MAPYATVRVLPRPVCGFVTPHSVDAVPAAIQAGIRRSRDGGAFAPAPLMIWFFKRGPHTAMVEVRRCDEHFEIVVRRPESPDSIQIAHRPADVFEYLEAAPRSLIAEGWQWKPRDPLFMLLAPLAPRAAHSAHHDRHGTPDVRATS